MRAITSATVTCLIILFLGSCSSHEPHPHPAPAPAPPGSVKKGGPPAHAKAHGYRRKFGYTYYPGKDVYYSKEKKSWFWIEKGEWKIGGSLPSHINLKNSTSKQIELDADTPYLHHKAQGVGNSHPGKGKGKSKGKGKGKFK